MDVTIEVKRMRERHVSVLKENTLQTLSKDAEGQRKDNLPLVLQIRIQQSRLRVRHPSYLCLLQAPAFSFPNKEKQTQKIRRLLANRKGLLRVRRDHVYDCVR